jgi:hypothetical protein
MSTQSLSKDHLPVMQHAAANAGQAKGISLHAPVRQNKALLPSPVPQLKSIEEEELPAQGKFVLQQAALPEEEQLAQGKFVAQFRPNTTGMPDQVKSGVEQLSGMDLSDVKVHYNSEKPSQLNAYAYAQGNDIHLGAGQEKHLPHEAWHVVQQRQDRVQATTQLKQGVPVNDDPSLENEADVMGAKALQAAAAGPAREE